MKLTIGQKILLGYGVAVVFLVIMGTAAQWSTGRLLEANDWVRHTFLVIVDIEDMKASLLGIESDYRGYLFTGDQRFLELIEGLRNHMDDGQKLFRTLTADNPGRQSRIDAVRPLIDRRLARLQQIADVRKEKGLSAAVAATQQTTGIEGTSEILNSLALMENDERTLLSERERMAKLGAANINQIFSFGTFVGLTLVALIAVVTHLSITRPLRDLQKFVAAVSDGDLTGKTTSEAGDELGKLAHGLNEMVTRLREMAAQTRAATENLKATAVQILASAREQSAVIGEQVAAYQETNATMQEVSQSCSHISEKAKQGTIAAEAVSIANISGLDAVQKTNQTVEAIHEQAEAVAQNIVSLSEKTQMVGDILATVNDIAEQSHLLALNAAIEAAAAGEHGRTFSVVAGEIKNLADQSKTATVQVKTILGDIQKEINTSVMLTEEAVKRVDVGKHQADVAASAIRNMAANIDQSVQAFQQIVAGTNQQQIGFENVMQALKDMTRASEQAATSTRQTEKAAASLTDIGKQLRDATERYRI